MLAQRLSTPVQYPQGWFSVCLCEFTFILLFRLKKFTYQIFVFLRPFHILIFSLNHPRKSAAKTFKQTLSASSDTMFLSLRAAAGKSSDWYL